MSFNENRGEPVDLPTRPLEGKERIRRIWPFSRVFQSKLSHRIEAAFPKRGEAIIFVARFLPGLRMPIFL
jgi:membrane protein DedA with SNARE-associated domain